MEQVHLYLAGTNGRPVQQSYTLTGSASIGPPKGKHQGKGPEPTTRTPPHPPQPGRPGHGTRGTPPQATRKRDRGRRARKGGGGGTHHQQTPARGGGEPHSRDGRGATTHSPHTHTEPPNQAQKGEDRHPNSPPTHRTHARVCTQHTPPQPPPTRAPQTHTTHQSTSTARTTNATHANPKNKNPATRRQGSCRAARNTARTQRWTQRALGQEWRAANTKQHPTNNAKTQDQALRHPHQHRHQHPNRTPQHPHQQKHPEPTETPSATPGTPAPSTTPKTPSPTTNQHKKATQH